MVALAVHADNYPHIGKGCTTAFYIDEDCDGYGVGTGYVLGVDADDTDPDIYNLATVEAEYGSMTSGDYLNNIKSYLCTVRGYCNIQDIYFLAANGNDSTGAVNDIDSPFLSVGYSASAPGVKKAGLDAGDLVLYRGGIYNETSSAVSFVYGPEGAVGLPIILMSFPGELAILGFDGGKITIGGDAPPNIKDHFIVDTFQTGYEAPGVGQGLTCPRVNNLTVRYVEFLYHWQGTRCQYDVRNTLLEHNVVHHNTGGGNHLNYWGGANNSSNQIFRDNIFYANVATSDYPLFQWNSGAGGGPDNLTWERNIFHSGRKMGLSLENGPFTNLHIRNNLFFNIGGPDIIVYNYAPDWEGEIESGYITNNIFWRGNEPGPYGGTDPEDFYSIGLQNVVDDDPHSFEIVNNIFYSYNNKIIRSDQDNHITNSNIKNNIIYRETGAVICSTESGDYNFSSFQNAFVSVNGNNNSDPLFENVSIGYNLNPDFFNFNLTSESPAIDFGTPTGAPSEDLRRNARDSSPDAGCYEYQSQYHAADSDEDGNVSTAELKGYIKEWKGGIVPISSLGSALNIWKS